MAAQGTGLPTPGGNSVTPLVDMAALGSGEKAAARAFDQLQQGLGRLHETVLAPQLQQRAREDTARAVQEGRLETGLPITEYAREYAQAVETGAVARWATEDDAALDAMVATNPYDPAAFDRASRGYLSEALKQTLDRFAIPRAQRFRERQSQVYGRMQIAMASRNVAEAGVHIQNRATELEAEIARKADAAATFDAVSDDFAGPVGELLGLWDEIAGNPTLQVSPEEAERRRNAALDRFAASAIAGRVRRAFREYGPAATLAEIEGLLPPDPGEEDLIG